MSSTHSFIPFVQSRYAARVWAVIFGLQQYLRYFNRILEPVERVQSFLIYSVGYLYRNILQLSTSRSNSRAVDIFWCDAGLTMADVGLSPLFDPNRLDLDEPGGVGGLETTELIHTRLLGVIQAFF